MPCRCCGASRPSKGFKERYEKEIHALLKEASKIILDKSDDGYDDIEEWKKGWKEAFQHMLNGCPENISEGDFVSEWISVKVKLPKELTHVVCYCPGINGHLPGIDWMDSDFCIGEHIEGIWKRVDNINIHVSHWLEIPEPPRE